MQNDGALMRLAGWTEAPQWYAYDPTGDMVTNTGLEPLNPTDFSGITSVEVTAPGADGTPIPLSIIYKKDLKMDGQNPCLMEGYGSSRSTIRIRQHDLASRSVLLCSAVIVPAASGKDLGYGGGGLES